MRLLSIHSIFFVCSLVFALVSCSNEPQAIEYGKDACHYCQMTIVDKIHGAEVVTDKGKVFKFDAAECLIRYKNSFQQVEGYKWVTNYFETPELFVSVQEATYLISDNLPSPMGAFLTAFDTREKAEEIQLKLQGELYDWEELQSKFKD